MAVKHVLRTLILSSLLLGSASALADQGKTAFDDYTIYHSAIPSTFISADMAKEYNLTRSRALGLLNVSVHKHGDDGGDLPNAIGARIEAAMTNSVQQRQTLSFRRVTEGDAIYYLAQFQYRDGKRLEFEIEATPQGTNETLSVNFSRELYYE